MFSVLSILDILYKLNTNSGHHHLSARKFDLWKRHQRIYIICVGACIKTKGMNEHEYCQTSKGKACLQFSPEHRIHDITRVERAPQCHCVRAGYGCCRDLAQPHTAFCRAIHTRSCRGERVHRRTVCDHTLFYMRIDPAQRIVILPCSIRTVWAH